MFNPIFRKATTTGYNYETGRFEEGEKRYLRSWVLPTVLIVGVPIGIITGANQIRNYAVARTEAACERYSQNTGLNIKFTATFWSANCWVTLPNGEIVEKDQIVGVVDGNVPG